ncbi:MAG: acyloxyacyl hydrolase [Alsobacter sp.]
MLTVLASATGAGAADLTAARPASPAPAASAPGWTPSPLLGLISEARIGVFAHDPWSPEKGSADINGEFLTVKPFSLGAYDVLVPRFNLGATVNTTGKTSQIYAGLTWTLDITHAVFIEGTLGGGYNNGAIRDAVPVDRNAVGCHANFRESASLGYRFTEQVSLMATVEHLSNAGLCDRNRGVTNVGIRLGYSF